MPKKFSAKEIPRITFSASITPITDTEKKKAFIALASVDELRASLPKVDLGKNIDLLSVSFSICSANRGNLNKHIIGTEAVINMYKGFIHKPINLEHERDNILGVILTANFSEFESDKILELEEVKGKTDPFNVTLGGVIWKLVAGENLCGAIVESSIPESKSYMKIGSSWEIGVISYNLALLPKGEKNLSKAIIVDDEAEINEIEAKMGKSRYYDGYTVYENVLECIPLAGAITSSPASQLYGVASQEPDIRLDLTTNEEGEAKTKDMTQGGFVNSPKEISAPLLTNESLMSKEACEKFVNLAERTVANVISSQSDFRAKNDSETDKNNLRVISTNQNTNTMPVIKTLKDITDENLKEAKASTILEVIDTELQAKAVEFNTQQNATKVALEAAEAARKAIASDLEKTKGELETLKTEFTKVQSEQAEKAKIEKFNQRMASFDERFELDAEDRKVLASTIQNMTDEAFATYDASTSVFMRGKSKALIAAQKEAASKMKEVKASTETPAAVVDAALENASVTTPSVPASISTNESFGETFKKAFNPESYELTVGKLKK
jgi:hypothetical protein